MLYGLLRKIDSDALFSGFAFSSLKLIYVLLRLQGVMQGVYYKPMTISKLNLRVLYFLYEISTDVHKNNNNRNIIIKMFFRVLKHRQKSIAILIVMVVTISPEIVTYLPTKMVG